jgi:hypothetical protein
MSTRLQRHVHHRPSRILPPLAAISESRPLSVQPPQLSMKPLANHRSVPHNNSSNQRVRAHSTPPVLRKLQSPQQMTAIRVSEQGIHG